MNILRNGWTWFALLLTVVLFRWPADLSGPLATCAATQAATEAQRDGILMQANLLAGEAQRLAGEVQKANQWQAGARRVIGQLELQCRAHNP